VLGTAPITALIAAALTAAALTAALASFVADDVLELQDGVLVTRAPAPG
jgi:hypothetical protein